MEAHSINGQLYGLLGLHLELDFSVCSLYSRRPAACASFPPTSPAGNLLEACQSHALSAHPHLH